MVQHDAARGANVGQRRDMLELKTLPQTFASRPLHRLKQHVKQINLKRLPAASQPGRHCCKGRVADDGRLQEGDELGYITLSFGRSDKYCLEEGKDLNRLCCCGLLSGTWR